MSLAVQTKKALQAIRADQNLLAWARYSIRYNSRRADQANDLMAKLHTHNCVSAELGNVKALAGALREIERDDRNN